jgi:hypothetical protein
MLNSADLGATNSGLLIIKGLWETGDVTCPEKCANRPFWVGDNPEKTMYNAVGNPQEIALRKSARIRDWRAISDVHRSRKRRVYREGVGGSPFSRRGLSLG